MTIWMNESSTRTASEPIAKVAPDPAPMPAVLRYSSSAGANSSSATNPSSSEVTVMPSWAPESS